MQTVTAEVLRPVDACWRVLTDATTFPHWVPGLRRANVIVSDANGRPHEVQFEFSTSRTYTLIYTYAENEVRFEPRLGKRDAVRGFTRLEPIPNGTRLTYGLEFGDARSEAEQALGDLEALVASFAHWMHGTR